MTPEGEADLVYAGPCDVGQGLFAARPIAAGRVILRLSGPELTLAEVRRKGAAAANSLQIGVNRYLDLESPGRLVNHSCRHNAYVQADVFLTAARDIPPDEEIRFDYSTTIGDGWTMPCACGQPECRGLVRAFLLLPPQLRLRYEILGAAQRFLREELGA